jgi:DNA-binding NarL/FixJ family response regulator
MGSFLRNKLDLEVVADSADIQDLLIQAESTQPDIILLDWELCDRQLEDLIATLHQLERQPGVVIINGMHDSMPAAAAAGADAYVLKGDPPKSLLIAIESVRLEREESKDL